MRKRFTVYLDVDIPDDEDLQPEDVALLVDRGILDLPTAGTYHPVTVYERGQTPGPWHVAKQGDGWLVYSDHERDPVAGATHYVAIGIQERRDADRIAAAPEMLTALREVQRALAAFRDGEDYVHPEYGQLALEEVKYRVVDVAIAKAEGDE